jgi:hypothetical protein
MNGKYAVNNVTEARVAAMEKKLKKDYRYFYGHGVGMAGRGEAIAFKDNIA